MQRYDVLLLDADNTLFDFTGAAAEALDATLRGGGLEPTPALMARYHEINDGLWAAFHRGETSREALTVERYRILLRELGRDPGPAEALNERYLTLLGERSRLLPGAEALCRRLADRCRLCIVTNGMATTQAARMAQTPIRDVIERVFVSQTMGCRKPQREFFDRVFAALELTPAQRARVVIVGDEPESDILGGRNAGVDTIWYNPAHRPAEPELVPTWEAADFEQIAAIVLGE